MQDGVVIRRIDAFVYRFPCPRPVSTSFGVMADRPAVFVRIEDETGAFGWGEIFANWPAAGAEHRANLLMRDVADLVLGVRFARPGDLFEKLERETHIRAVQCGEPGPFRQATAGLDMALWDLFARAGGAPLRRYLDGAAATSVPVYASGIHVRDGEEFIAAARAKGVRHFKVKIGFDLDLDAAQVRSLVGGLQSGERLFTDANQAWDLATALSFVRKVDGCDVGWLEEPLPVDAPQCDWEALAHDSPIPLAGGENIAGSKDFEAAIRTGALSVLQPDIAKWGGITGCLGVAREAMAAGRRYCPHFLGGGVGLVASAHLLAAAGGDGLLEVDINANPLRDAIADGQVVMRDGRCFLSDAPGLGIEELPRELITYQTLSVSRSV
ncbi:MAG: mandelate racemase/muconate lactonizing enzyme family protein [Alphaproteobacteria bacterium]|nr:mandelate racemase/muconate lactonizing enzyme family protein [Alphaproteobacteria bacterium]